MVVINYWNNLIAVVVKHCKLKKREENKQTQATKTKTKRKNQTQHTHTHTQNPTTHTRLTAIKLKQELIQRIHIEGV